MTSITNKDIVKLFKEVAAALTVKGENRFKIIAYQQAADSISHISEELQDIWVEGRLTDIPGIGAGIASHLEELFKTGKVAYFNHIKKNLPKAMFTLMALPNFGARKSYNLSIALKIKDNSDPIKILEEAAIKHKISGLKGFGEKSEEQILESIESYRTKKAKLSRMLISQALEAANKIIDYLKNSKQVIEAIPLGSLRRMSSTVGDIDIAVSTNNPKEVIQYFTQYENTRRIIEKGEKTSSIMLNNGIQIDLMTQTPESFGSLLQHFTGSKNHNIHLREYALKKGMSLSEYGIRIRGKLMQFKNEEEFYKKLGMKWIPPELREDKGEIEAALISAQGKSNGLPDLIKLKDIKGDLHLHSNYSIEPSHDLGNNTVEEIIKKARDLNYSYVGFTEHNPSVSKHSEAQIFRILKGRKEYLDHIISSTEITRVKILNMLEIDILPNGELAVPEKAFEYIDYAIISIHSSFRQPSESMTNRILKALSFPKVKIFAHPTGRLIERREGVQADWNKIFTYTKEKKIALEINANPYRSDLPDNLIKDALYKGNKFVISTDSHSISEMDLMKYGIANARRGWLTKEDVINTFDYNKIKEWLNR